GRVLGLANARRQRTTGRDFQCRGSPLVQDHPYPSDGGRVRRIYGRGRLTGNVLIRGGVEGEAQGQQETRHKLEHAARQEAYTWIGRGSDPTISPIIGQGKCR